MPIKNIRRDHKGELILEGDLSAFDSRKSSLTGKEISDMIEECKAAGGEEIIEQYRQDILKMHSKKEDYDSSTGQVKKDTKAHIAREILVKYFDMKEEDLHNPLYEPIPLPNKLSDGDFRTEYAADVLAQIPGVERKEKEGHDIPIKYKGRVHILTGGSRQNGQTDRNAVDQVIQAIIEQDLKLGHIHENHKDRRRDAIKASIYEK